MLRRWRSKRAANVPMPRPEIPLPPPEMRALVGLTDPQFFANPSGRPVFDGLPAEQYRSVLDFGCGCGRIARQLMQQSPRPQRYEGVDLHAGMVRWCSENLTPVAPEFIFRHHDVLYEGFNPGEGKPRHDRLPFGEDEFSLIVAISVFTHLTQGQAEAYLAELARVLEPTGVLQTTWFLFQKRDFPMMNEDQSTLFINEYDVRNAVIYDREWLRSAASRAGLVVCEARPPAIRGFHWELRLTPARTGAAEAEWPADDGPAGRQTAPMMPLDAHRIGEK